jgi:hypothetical protein
MVFAGIDGRAQLYEPASNRTEGLGNVRGTFLGWAPDGKHISSVISASHADDPEAGVWIYDSTGGTPRQVFRGWVAYYAWAGADELFVLNSAATRVDLMDPGSAIPQGYFRFDVHPDHRRIVTEAFRFHESDIGMIENVP